MSEKVSSASYSPSSSSSSSHRQASELNTPSANHQRRSSIVDMLSTPPPIHLTPSSTSSIDKHYHHHRTSSSASSEDSSVISSHPDWPDVPLTDLVQPEKLTFVDANESVEKAFDILEQLDLTSLPIRNGSSKDVSHTFDYADLNAYLLLVLGHIEPIEDSPFVKENVVNARSGKEVPVKFVSQLGINDPFVSVSASSTLSTAVEILGNGVHRIAIYDANDPHTIVGILSQRRLVDYIWQNGRLFKSLEQLFQTPLKNLLKIGTEVITINGEDLVINALIKMHSEGVSSLAVVDNQQILIGNISIVDVRLLTKSSQSPLLQATCKHFLYVILSKRGLIDGKDSYPVFHVTPESTLGRTIAKLVATRSHRLWIIKDGSSPAITAAAGGPLIGVVSLTDILHLLARHAGKGDGDPTDARRERRRSSSSSVRRQSSVDAFRRSSFDRR